MVCINWHYLITNYLFHHFFPCLMILRRNIYPESITFIQSSINAKSHNVNEIMKNFLVDCNIIQLLNTERQKKQTIFSFKEFLVNDDLAIVTYLTFVYLHVICGLSRNADVFLHISTMNRQQDKSVKEQCEGLERI